MAAPFTGKVALVTGAGPGIGRASALAFAREGASVVVADRAVDAGEETVRLVESDGGRARFIATDVARADDVQRLVQQAVELYGRLDYAHNNAGIAHGGATHELAEEVWDSVLAINLTGVWLCMKHEIGQMLRQGGGSIVNTASAAGLVGGSPAAYTASKFGVVGLTKTTAIEYAARGIRINAVCPAWTETAMTRDIWSDPSRLAAAIADQPMARFTRPDEVAAAVIWLCSDASSSVTGIALPIDGGYTAR